MYIMLSNIQKRFLLFIFGCVGSRSLFAYVAKIASKQVLFYLGALALLPALGFVIIYFTGIRNTGAEVFGSTIWWDDLRIVHSLLYTLFAIYAFQGKSFAWVPLGIDVTIGVLAFIVHHYREGSFQKLLENKFE